MEVLNRVYQATCGVGHGDSAKAHGKELQGQTQQTNP
jgi:hypothetical protein